LVDRGRVAIAQSVILSLSKKLRATMNADRGPVIVRDPEILSGMPVFAGTRVPARNLIDYLEHGHSLDEFLDDFPTVSREQVIAALEEVRELLLTHAVAAG
jgi:uncharacterized protein (DUF433 family)